SAHLCLIPTPYQPRSTLFPYTTLFRSAGRAGGQRGSAEVALLGRSRSSERVPYASPIGSTSCSQGAPHRSGGEIHYRITGSSQASNPGGICGASAAKRGRGSNGAKPEGKGPGIEPG